MAGTTNFCASPWKGAKQSTERDSYRQFWSLVDLIDESLKPRSVYPEPLHFGDQCRTLEPQPSSCSSRPSYHSSGSPQCLQDQSCFVLAQCALWGNRGDGIRL